MLTSLADMWQQHKFTPAWGKSQWVQEVSKHFPLVPIGNFKQMKTKQLIAIWHNIRSNK